MYLLQSGAELERLLRERPDLWLPDNLLTLQEYFAVDAARGIVRMEFLAGELLYAMRVVSYGAFNLCPSETCNPEVGGAGHCDVPSAAPVKPSCEKLDAATQRLLNRGARLTELLKQPQYQPMPTEEEVVAIYAGVRGYLDKLPVSAVQRFEAEFLRLMRSKHKDVLDAIRTGKQLTPEIETKLKAILDEFSKSFA